jgi:hypothetical protein
VVVEPSPDHVLMGRVHVRTETPCIARLTVDGPGVDARRATSAESAPEHHFLLAELRERSTYTVRVGLECAAASREYIRSFTTGHLPFSIPDLQVRVPGNLDGVVLFGVTDVASGPPFQRAIFVAIDHEGHVVWYYRDPRRGADLPVIRQLPDGTLFLTLAGEARIIDLEGNILRRWMQDDPAAGWHHDRQLLPDGGLLALAFDARILQDGSRLLADQVLELAPDGTERGRWSAADALDITPFPSQLSTGLLGDAIDWSHGNGLALTPDEAGFVVSLRHQHWIVRVDRDTGDVDWRFGPDGDFTLTAGSWFDAQHAPVWVADDELLVYDNGVERHLSTGAPSRVVRYRLDEANRTAAEVWSWDIPAFTPIVGNAQPWGDHTFVAAGGRFDHLASFYLVQPDGEIAWELETEGMVFQASLARSLMTP